LVLFFGIIDAFTVFLELKAGETHSQDSLNSNCNMNVGLPYKAYAYKSASFNNTGCFEMRSRHLKNHKSRTMSLTFVIQYENES